MIQLKFKKSWYMLLCLPAAVVLTVFPFAGANAVVVPVWTQTTQADFASGTLWNVDISTSPGDVILAGDGDGYVYAFRGNLERDFWRYDIAHDEWSSLPEAPHPAGPGGALVSDGVSYIYALFGSDTDYFSRFNISTGEWLLLNNTPHNINAGGALTYDGGDYIYALAGGDTRYFSRYSISAGTWTDRALLPNHHEINGGGALAYGGSYIYALEGGSSDNFWKYSPSYNTWYSRADTPAGVSDGGALSWGGGDYLYALKGADTVTFWRYNISGNNWSSMADTPSTPCVYGGGALTYDGNGNFYALRGNDEVDFWEYSVPGNTWDTKAGTPDTVSYGGALAYKRAPYYSSGDFTSSTFSPGYAADFGSLSWTATVPSGTAIKFQIATANSASGPWVFSGPDGTASTWYTSSGTAIRAGHDGDRYIKYKAFLNTSDAYATPVLYDISIDYTQMTVSPSPATLPATAVEETDAALNGGVDDDGGAACQYRFQYGTEPGSYSADTGWTGSVHTGQAFSANLTGLSQGTYYYYRAQLKNSAGTGSGAELGFLTKPEEPDSLMASAVSGTQIDLYWDKGAGADRTKVLRKTGGYPAGYDDPAAFPVYFDTGETASDTGLSPGVTYYYRAWSEVTVGSVTQWSDDFKSVTMTTSTIPAADTLAAALVEETTATLNGQVTYDGGEACQYRFEYGTVPGVYTTATGWTGAVYADDFFSADVTGLAKGTKYYFRAQVKNSAGTGSGLPMDFLTKPDPPLDGTFTATVISETEISLTWQKGEGALNTVIYRKINSYPTDRNDPDAELVYYDTGTGFTDTGLTPDTLYRYRAWSQVEGSEQWSDGYRDVSAQTSITPTTTPPATTPISVGGDVYPVSKSGILAPWIAGFLFLLAAGWFGFRAARARRRV